MFLLTEEEALELLEKRYPKAVVVDTITAREVAKAQLKKIVEERLRECSGCCLPTSCFLLLPCDSNCLTCKHLYTDGECVKHWDEQLDCWLGWFCRLRKEVGL